MTTYRVPMAAEIVELIRDGTAVLPEHMTVREVGPPPGLGRYLVVTFEDSAAPERLEGRLIEPVFTQHADGRVTVEYGDPLDQS